MVCLETTWVMTNLEAPRASQAEKREERDSFIGNYPYRKV
jgi:hypothetical protein